MIFLYGAEYGGYNALKDFKKYVKRNEDLKLFNKKELYLTKSRDEIIYKINNHNIDDIFIICPGINYDKGKNFIELATKKKCRVIGFVDHFTNPWQRFSDELTGQILKYAPNEIIVRSDICRRRIIDKGFKGEIMIFPIFEEPNFIDERSEINEKIKDINIAFITEWYDKPCKFILDQASWETQEIFLNQVAYILKNENNLKFTIRIHPHLKDSGWKIPDKIKNLNCFVDSKHLSNTEIIKRKPIFLGIDSNFLIDASRNGCEVYTWHNNKNEFKLSNYIRSIKELKNLEDLRLKLNLF